LIPVILIASLEVSPNGGNPEELSFGSDGSEISSQTKPENWKRVGEYHEEKTLTCSWGKKSQTFFHINIISLFHF